MKHLHIWPNEKFTNPYIDFINSNFNTDEHLFLIIGTGIAEQTQKYTNVIELKGTLRDYVYISKQMNRFKNIYLHSLNAPRIVEILFVQPWLLKKCNWIIWGGDLYKYRVKTKTLKSKIYEIMRRQVIRNVGGIITHIEGDYRLAKKWYDSKAKYSSCFLYPSNIYKKINLSEVAKDNKKLYIQVGNSANPTNNHEEVFYKLKKMDFEDFIVYCPLAYGDKEYANRIIKSGSNIFGENFVPLTEFLSYEDYLLLLSKIDIAIFNHDRQQAVGNITNLLGMGKKVYLREDITTWNMLQNLELEVFSINKDFDDLLEPLSEKHIQRNSDIIASVFAEENLIREWDTIFKSP